PRGPGPARGGGGPRGARGHPPPPPPGRAPPPGPPPHRRSVDEGAFETGLEALLDGLALRFPERPA
ncbi:hypothetical protein ACFV0G_21540, partial [Kitasatospora sp. NPDC059571]